MIRYRKVPDHSSDHTYWFDVAAEGEVPQFVGTVRRVAHPSGNPIPWMAWPKDDESIHGYGRTRALAVEALFRQIKVTV